MSRDALAGHRLQLDALRSEMLRGDADETHPYMKALDAAIAALEARPGCVVDYVDIANRVQEITGRGMMPSTIKTVLDVAALAAPKASEAVASPFEAAWLAICDALDSVDPDWMMHGPEGADAAVALIRKLGATTPPADPALPVAVTGWQITREWKTGVCIVPPHDVQVRSHTAKVSLWPAQFGDRNGILLYELANALLTGQATPEGAS